ncbi:MAG: PSD1 and planctomycete cytochrome C domain-containing protein [Phycisphaeraceae bacterium]
MKCLPLIAIGLVLSQGCGEVESQREVPVVEAKGGRKAELASLSFNRDIRPILSDKCFACHGPDRNTLKAELRLDTPENGEGYDGAYFAITPGDPDASELATRIHSNKAKTVMPPPAVKNPLTAQEKALLVRWIEEGAEYEPHWSFTPIAKQDPPEVAGDEWSRNAIDRFVYARLSAKGIEPSPEAGRVAWLRRVTQDLTGLPPTVEAIDAFIADQTPDAYKQVVDRLLKSDHYAERMANVWLDNARYADSNGFQFDNQRAMWPWRDWVIKAYQQNMPYDQFVTEQLAGDLLPEPTEDQRLATGFNRNHPITIEGGVINEEYRVTNINDRTTTMGTLFMGLTLECSRCHDHKYDPITIDEYYQLFAFFNTSADGGIAQFKKPLAPFIERDGGAVMVIKEKPRDTHILLGGQFDQHGEQVIADTPAVLPAFGDRPRNRLGLSQWLLADDNPLMARVTVNRLWQRFFGVGLVKTPDNVGLQAEMPSHPLLLDYLASDFRDSGWDLHHLIKSIVLSATYRQDATHRPELEDPENRLLARGPSFRLPAEMIRDQALFASGLMTQKVGGPSVFPYQPDGVWEDLNAPPSHAEVYKQSTGEDLYRKSLYTYWRRAALHPAMAIFDAPSRDVCSVKRETTNTPLQALAVLHDKTYVEASRKLAERVVKQQPDDARAQIALVMRSVISRVPTEQEAKLLVGLYEQRLTDYRADPSAAAKLMAVGESRIDETLDANRVAALADVALAVFNTSEALTRK